VTAVTALNIIDICITSICNLLIIAYIVRKCLQKHRLYFLSFTAKASFPLFFLLYGSGIFIFNLMKLVSNGGDTIGYDIKITIVASLLQVFLFSGLVLYFRLIITFMLGYARMMSAVSSQKVRTRFASLSFFSWFIPPFSVIICLIQSLGLLYPDSAEEIGMFYNIGIYVHI
jgi:hypothetical protein